MAWEYSDLDTVKLDQVVDLLINRLLPEDICIEVNKGNIAQRSTKRSQSLYRLSIVLWLGLRLSGG